LELELDKNQEISNSLRSEVSEISEKFENLNSQFQVETAQNEKKMKSKERQIQEIRKELQKTIDKNKESVIPVIPAKIELVTETVENGNESKNGNESDESPIDTDYLKHIVLRLDSLTYNMLTLLPN